MTDPRELIVDRLIDALAMCYEAEQAGHTITQITKLEQCSEAIYRDWLDGDFD